jgi:hypothetical protein
MKKEHDEFIDSVFNDALKDFESEPSLNVWKNISTHVANVRKARKKKMIFLSSSIIISAILIIAFLFHLTDSQTNQKAKKVENIHTALPLYMEKEIKQSKSQENKVDKENSNTAINKEISENTGPVYYQTKVFGNENKNESYVQYHSENIADSTTEVKEDAIIIYEHSGKAKSIIDNKTIFLLFPLKIFLVKNGDLSLGINKTFTEQDTGNNKNRYHPLYYGAYFGYDYINNIPELNNEESINKSPSFGISLNYDKKNISFQIGLSVSKYSNKSYTRFDYLAKDSIGYYNDVYGVDFINVWDPVLLDSVLHVIYHTLPVPVYDSVQHIRENYTRNHYLYLALPITVGYKFYIKRSFITIRTGYSFGLLAYKKEPDAVYSENGTLLNSYYQKLNTYRFNNQFLLSMGYGYYVTKDLNFSIEPIFKYSLNQIKDINSNALHPYSLGVMAGIYYHF